jgi:two-component system, cell cycle response regulator DivK
MPPVALLVDRDADTRLMYGEYLRQLTYQVDEADDGREALAKAISRHPAVIVTETRLPGMSGLELCRLLRHDSATRGIPIVVVTGDAFASDLTLAKAAGADAVLVKPCLPEQLEAEIRRVLSETREESRPHQPRDTADPPQPPPTLLCPECDEPLRYQRSRIGGVNDRHREQWDYFECRRRCGMFEYRQRTRKVRRVG